MTAFGTAAGGMTAITAHRGYPWSGAMFARRHRRPGPCTPASVNTTPGQPDGHAKSAGSHPVPCDHGLAVALGAGAVVLVPLGAGNAAEPEGAAATASAIAPWSRFCAWPYAAKSPLFRAVCPSVYAF